MAADAILVVFVTVWRNRRCRFVIVIIVDVILVAPATIALVTFVVPLAVVTTTFLVVDVGLIFDCCVCCRLASLSRPLLPSPSSSPSSPSSSPSSIVADHCHLPHISAFILLPQPPPPPPLLSHPPTAKTEEDALAGVSARPRPVVLVGQSHHKGERGIALGVPHHLPRQEGSTNVIRKRQRRHRQR